MFTESLSFKKETHLLQNLPFHVMCFDEGTCSSGGHSFRIFGWCFSTFPSYFVQIVFITLMKVQLICVCNNWIEFVYIPIYYQPMVVIGCMCVLHCYCWRFHPYLDPISVTGFCAPDSIHQSYFCNVNLNTGFLKETWFCGQILTKSFIFLNSWHGCNYGACSCCFMKIQMDLFGV